jgi:hypothetical protein
MGGFSGSVTQKRLTLSREVDECKPLFESCNQALSTRSESTPPNLIVEDVFGRQPFPLGPRRAAHQRIGPSIMEHQ